MKGTIVVEPGTVVIDRSFQTASWWRKLELVPGEYTLEKSQPGTMMNWVSIPGTIVEDFFPSSLFGVTSSYDGFQNAGKLANYSVMRYDYQLQEGEVLKGCSSR